MPNLKKKKYINESHGSLALAMICATMLKFTKTNSHTVTLTGNISTPAAQSIEEFVKRQKDHTKSKHVLK